MRRLFVLAMAGATLGLSGLARDARAGSTVDLLFVAINGSPIAPTHTVSLYGDPFILTMHVFMSTDQPLTSAVFSINYDLGGEDELDVVSAFQWNTGVVISKSGTDFFRPISAVPNPLTHTSTSIESMEGATTNRTLPRALPANPAFHYQMGTVVWMVKSGLGKFNDGADIVSGLLAQGIDGWYDSAFNAVSTSTLVFDSATVNFVPEPGTGSLLGLGLVCLLLARCRASS